MDKRYQVFLSSTFLDLIEERQKVLFSLQKMNHIPAGMEFFPSANEEPWDVIKRVIGLSDYYVLIIGGRYGSTDENGISYTEREYDLAVELSIPVLAFLHGDPDNIPLGKSELGPESRSKLEELRRKVQDKHHCDFWSTADNLATKVTIGLATEIASRPRSGWVRADLVEENNKLLGRLEKIRTENETLRQQFMAAEQRLASTEESHEFLQGTDKVTLTLSESIEVEGKYKIETHKIERSWHDIFMAIAWSALSGATSDTLCKKVALLADGKYFVDDEMWQEIVIQFLALNLISVSSELRVNRNSRRYLSDRMSLEGERTPTDLVPTEIWRLTKEGIRLLAQSKATRRECD